MPDPISQTAHDRPQTAIRPSQLAIFKSVSMPLRGTMGDENSLQISQMHTDFIRLNPPIRLGIAIARDRLV